MVFTDLRFGVNGGFLIIQIVSLICCIIYVHLFVNYPFVA